MLSTLFFVDDNLPCMHIRQAQFPLDIPAIVTLVREYAAWLNIDMSFQNFEQEMLQIESIYSLPKGLFWVVEEADKLVGCVGFKHLDATTAEVKRLYVQPAFRGQQLGEKLMQVLTDTTRQLGYQRLVLDTVPQTAFAQTLYQRMGFAPIAQYYDGPTLATQFFELPLRTS
jgi:putative acetyltransferase